MTKDTERAALYRAMEFISEICDEYCIPRPFGLFEDLDAALAQEAQAVPEGWEVKRGRDNQILVFKDGIGGVWCRKEGYSSIAESILFHIAEKWLAAAPQSVPAQPVAWRAENVGAIYDQMQKSAPPAAEQDVPRALTDEQVEQIIEQSDGFWVDDEFRINAKDLARLIRAAGAK